MTLGTLDTLNDDAQIELMTETMVGLKNEDSRKDFVAKRAQLFLLRDAFHDARGLFVETQQFFAEHKNDKAPTEGTKQKMLNYPSVITAFATSSKIYAKQRKSYMKYVHKWTEPSTSEGAVEAVKLEFNRKRTEIRKMEKKNFPAISFSKNSP